MVEAGEIKAYAENAREQLIDAEIALREKRHRLSFLCSALSAENAASALIITLGRRVSGRHSNWAVLGSPVTRIDEGLRAMVKEISVRLHRIEPHIRGSCGPPPLHREGW